MATLTKGISYRRQGSSGLIWADNMVLTEEGMFAMNRFQKIKDNVTIDGTAGEPQPGPVMARSKSVGSASSSIPVAAPPTSRHKSSFSVVKWLKKAITKMKR